MKTKPTSICRFFRFSKHQVCGLALLLVATESGLAAPGSSLRVAIFGAPSTASWNNDVSNKLAATSLIPQVDAFTIATNPIPTLVQLEQYQAVLIYSDAGFSDSVALGNVLADYLDAGGGVVINTFAFYSSPPDSIQGRLGTNGYLPFTTGNQTNGASLGFSPNLPSHPILSGVNSFNGGTGGYRNGPIATVPTATQIAQWIDGLPLAAASQLSGGRIAGLNFYPPSSTARADFWTATTDGGRLMANALVWAAGNGSTTILSTTNSWNGDGIAPFGEPNTATYGQTFVVPTNATTLASFTVFIQNSSSNVTFKFYLAPWDGTKAVSPILYQSPVTNTAAGRTNWAAYTFNLPNIPVPSGHACVAFLSTSAVQDGGSSSAQMGLVPNSTYTNGTFVYLNNGTNVSSLTNTAWTVYNAADNLAFAATFNGAVLGAPMILTQPVSVVTAPVGGTATFSLVASGGLPLHYTWLQNGTPIGAPNLPTYVLTNVQPVDSGSLFSCVVSNAVNVVTSSVTLLKVETTVANDQCLNAIVITNDTYSNVQSTAMATSFGDPVPDCVPGFGNGVWYAVIPPFDGQLEVDTFGSDFDTGLAVYTGACGAMTEVACNDDTGGLTSQVILSVSAGVTNFILAGGFSEYVGNLHLHTLLMAPPTIIYQPQDQIAAVGYPAEFDIFAQGTSPLSYFWSRNGSPISGATGSSYIIPNPQFTDSGSTYSCVVSNAYGTVISSNALLTVTPPPTFLTGNYLYLPIAYNGVFLANHTGGKYNPAGTGGASGIDFWEPGTPVYNYTIGVGGTDFINGNFSNVAIANLSSGAFQHALITGTVTNGLAFSRDVSFGTNSKIIQLVDTLLNTGQTTLSNIVTLDSTDPDQDSGIMSSNATYATINDVVSVNRTNDMVIASGPVTGITLGFGSDSGIQIPSATNFDNTDPYSFLTVTDPNGATNDIDINLVQNYGNLAPGQIKSVVWYIVFGDTPAQVTNNFGLNAASLPDHFVWNNLGPRVDLMVPFQATITAFNASGQTASNFSGPVSVSGSTLGAATNLLFEGLSPTSSGSGTLTWGYPFTPTNNIIVTHVSSYFGTKVTLWTAGGTLLASQAVSSPSGFWTETALPGPILLNANSNYIVAAYVSAGTYYSRSSSGGAFANGTIGTSVFTSSDGFPTTASPGVWPLVGLRYSPGPARPIAIAPVTTGNFVNGVWSGDLSVLQTATNAYLVANFGSVTPSLSSAFNVGPGLAIYATNGVIDVSISGAPGEVYQIQSSSNLVTWQTLATLTNLTGIVEYTDPGKANHRFFRWVMP